MLRGRKTYICAISIALVTLARQMLWIDETSFQALLGIFGAGGMASLRSAVSEEK